MQPQKLQAFRMFHWLSHGEYHIIETSAFICPNGATPAPLLQVTSAWRAQWPVEASGGKEFSWKNSSWVRWMFEPVAAVRSILRTIQEFVFGSSWSENATPEWRLRECKLLFAVALIPDSAYLSRSLPQLLHLRQRWLLSVHRALPAISGASTGSGLLQAYSL